MLKDWKKVLNKPNWIKWQNKKTEETIWVSTADYPRKVFYFNSSENDASNRIYKDFKSKTEAMRYAMKYMRNN